ncbi:MAG: hypothetical protein ACLRJV_14265 [Eubacteriales bacterium]
MTLSEFILLGLAERNIPTKTPKAADALNTIQPDFIRVHAPGFKPGSMMWQLIQNGTITLQSEEEIVQEQRLFYNALMKWTATM